MANNIKANAPNAVVAKATALFSGISVITADSIGVIFLVDDPLKSYVPGRGINAITGFTAGKGYYIQAKTAIDLSPYVSAPFAMLLSGLADVAVAVGATVNLTASATDGTAPFTSQFYKNGVAIGSPVINSSSDFSKTITSAQTSDSGYYSLGVSDASGATVYTNFSHVVVS